MLYQTPPACSPLPGAATPRCDDGTRLHGNHAVTVPTAPCPQPLSLTEADASTGACRGGCYQRSRGTAAGRQEGPAHIGARGGAAQAKVGAVWLLLPPWRSLAPQCLALNPGSLPLAQTGHRRRPVLSSTAWRLCTCRSPPRLEGAGGDPGQADAADGWRVVWRETGRHFTCFSQSGMPALGIQVPGAGSAIDKQATNGTHGPCTQGCAQHRMACSRQTCHNRPHWAALHHGRPLCRVPCMHDQIVQHACLQGWSCCGLLWPHPPARPPPPLSRSTLVAYCGVALVSCRVQAVQPGVLHLQGGTRGLTSTCCAGHMAGTRQRFRRQGIGHYCYMRPHARASC